MSFFGTRRTRQTQARVFRPTPSLWDRCLSAFSDYRVLSQILIMLLAVVLLLLALQAWNPRFRYRAGQYIDIGIQSRIDFEVKNEAESARIRRDAEADAPVVFVQEPTVIDRLVSQLRAQLSEVSNANSVGDLSVATQEAFGFTSVSEIEREQAFSLLHNLLQDADESSGKRLDELMVEFEKLLADTRTLGLIDNLEAMRLTGDPLDGPVNRSEPLKVVDAQDHVLHNGILADVLLDEQLRETGRLGKLWPTLPKLSAIKSNIETWLHQNLKNQLRPDAAATKAELLAAADRAKPLFDRYQRNAILIPAGSQLIEAEKSLGILRLEFEAYSERLTLWQRISQINGIATLLVLLVVLFGVFLRLFIPEMLEDKSQLVIFVTMCAAAVFLSCVMSADPWRAEIIPLLAIVMITAIAYSQVVAILTAFLLSLLVSMATLGEIGHFLTLMTICVTSTIPLRRIKSRLVMVKAGFLVATVSFYAVWSTGVIQAEGSGDVWRNVSIIVTALKFAGWALVCCYLVAGSLPFIEQAFGIVTDISLLELTGVSHPLLLELARRAPGTYNHSMTVASLAEAAAEAIGANGLLTRVGAYFHDIGKMLKPEYFIENMTEGSANPHNTLAPAMSTLIIIGHVKDGLELAEEHNLPEPLVNFIEQHHGTTLVEYFYHEATRKADVDHRTDASESNFRYPGSKPQSRETAVLMVADAVESASRTLKEPTPKRIQSLVHEITMKRLLDGQFNECNLQMNEIRIIEESLIKSLLAAHHGRVRYPGQRTA
ncbi:MAG TPA: HDIG domain-containing protein [Planctomycetaceae bacterium]|nr:HDIG domain-containing protein [Planctomycetaceae bacterium]